MATAQTTRHPGRVLSGIDWRTYSRLLRIFANRPGIRLTYDRGDLDIMSPLPEHETAAYLLGRFVDVLTDALRVRVKAGRSTTFRRRRKRRGLEPDNSYWIQNESKVRGKQHIDLRIDPPPDLAIEIDVTHSSIDRMSIYAALGVPEVWRLDEPGLTFHVLGSDGHYAEVTHSRAFPFVTPKDLECCLALRTQTDDTDVVDRFRAWVVAQLTPPQTAP